MISNFLYKIYIIIATAIAPAKPAVFVFKITNETRCASSFVAILPTLPPLNPNQPIHKSKAPKVTKGIFEAGITLTPPSFVYLPVLAPTISKAANKAQPPVLCITVEPAKSCIDDISKIVSFRKFEPQVKFTTKGYKTELIITVNIAIGITLALSLIPPLITFIAFPTKAI